MNLIQGWVDKQNLVRLIIGDENTTKINELFMIESILWGESNQDNGDIPFTIWLREFVQMHAPVTNWIEQMREVFGK